MKTPIEIILDHALSTLPDSLSQRQKLLRAIFNALSPKHPQYKHVMEMMAALDLHEAAQKKLFGIMGQEGNGK